MVQPGRTVGLIRLPTRRRIIVVNDRMQQGYRYECVAPVGQNFDAEFKPELTPQAMLALGVFGVKAWANVYLTPPSADAMPIQVQAGQFAFYFRYPGPDGKFGPIHADKISEATQNFYGLDQDHDQDSKDDIVTAQMAVPVNKEVHLLMHTKDVGHSFFVPELRVQQDFVPGLDVTLHFTATKVGRYEIVCTQLCGLGHYNMKAYISVLSQPDFDDWLKKQAALQ